MEPETAEFYYLNELDDQSAASAIWSRYDALRHAWYRGLMSFAEFRTATRRYYDMVTWWNGRAVKDAAAALATAQGEMG